MQARMAQEIAALAEQVGATLVAQNRRLACAESCSGGLLASTLTLQAGCSAWFDCAIVAYSNDAKERQLGVSLATMVEHGAVSEAVVRQMAQGLLANSVANVVLAMSGIAGPSGGSEHKPVGMVWLVLLDKTGRYCAKQYQFDGDRQSYRQQLIRQALSDLLSFLA